MRKRAASSTIACALWIKQTRNFWFFPRSLSSSPWRWASWRSIWLLWWWITSFWLVITLSFPFCTLWVILCLWPSFTLRINRQCCLGFSIWNNNRSLRLWLVLSCTFGVIQLQGLSDGLFISVFPHFMDASSQLFEQPMEWSHMRTGSRITNPIHMSLHDTNLFHSRIKPCVLCHLWRLELCRNWVQHILNPVNKNSQTIMWKIVQIQFQQTLLRQVGTPILIKEKPLCDHVQQDPSQWRSTLHLFRLGISLKCEAQLTTEMTRVH